MGSGCIMTKEDTSGIVAAFTEWEVEVRECEELLFSVGASRSPERVSNLCFLT